MCGLRWLTTARSIERGLRGDFSLLAAPPAKQSAQPRSVYPQPARLRQMDWRADEERERRVFFSWQSDTPAKANRTVIEAALDRAAKTVGAAWTPSDRPVTKIETASSDVVGARQIADVLLERIRSADVFVADASLVVRKGPRVMPNPNVLVETGYALHALGDARIVLVVNTALGAVEKLPFDLRGRLALTYSMKPTDAPAAARDNLTRAFTRVLTPILTLPRTTQDVRVDVGVFDALSLDTTSRESMFIVTVRNFSEFPLHLVSLSYEYEGAGGGFLYGQHGPLLATPIPARDSRTFLMPEAAVRRERKVGRVVVKDSLDREFSSQPGAVETALRERPIPSSPSPRETDGRHNS